VLDPDDADRRERDGVSDVRRPLVEQVAGEILRASWVRQVEHEQCDRDRDDPVDEGVQATG